MDEDIRKKLNDLNRELVLANTDYNDLQQRVDSVGKCIADLKIEIDNILNGE